MERAGVPRTLAMKIRAHKTESIYWRYAIATEQDIADGLRKVVAFQKGVAWSQVRDKSRTVGCPGGRVRGRKLLEGWWPGTELNRRHANFQTCPPTATTAHHRWLSVPIH
jgi:hypothetical protein